MVFCTSGTTGVPKGAVLSHLNLVMNATANTFDANDVRPDDVALGALPLFHLFGQTVGTNSAHPHFGARAGTVGHAIRGVEVEIARPESARSGSSGCPTVSSARS